MDKLHDKEVRAKLFALGAESLSDVELVSILIGEGHDGLSAIDLAQRALSGVGDNLPALADLDMTRMRMNHGLGVKRAAMLCCAFELGRRLVDNPIGQATSITSNEDVLTMFSPMLTGLAHEEFWVLYLSTANTILQRVRVSQGGVSGTVVDYKLIVKRAVELLAASIIVVHNHPSGISAPSEQDLEMTQKLALGASLFDIVLLDHLIVAKTESFSFRHNGLLKQGT